MIFFLAFENWTFVSNVVTLEIRYSSSSGFANFLSVFFVCLSLIVVDCLSAEGQPKLKVVSCLF